VGLAAIVAVDRGTSSWPCTIRVVALGLSDVMVGCWTDEQANTGVTVILPPAGSLGAVAIRGGAPGTREVAALAPETSGQECHGVVLCGSSVFGLAAADGVVDWCVRNDRGLLLRDVRVPIVAAAVVFDIDGPNHARLGPQAGEVACASASFDDPPEGSVGVGRGCSVGKHGGREFASKGGQGWAVARSGDAVVGAIMAVNAFGDVLDESGDVLAGSRAPKGTGRYPHLTLDELRAWDGSEIAGSNTTIGCLVTNVALDKAGAHRAADLSHAGLSRTIDPAHTAADGDALFLLSTGHVAGSADLVADLGARAVAEAIRRAVRAAA